ncbi:hypothetical protein TARUN_7455 [Trichoderma arundinaceum]|uniref:Uncharacterized protein n=1 Tax=Trichoderma arundinaceum TaxID=490622 RepID=A0A395NF77_TRIAR|nr:hypothetical protein TARUN_7455 [Trichoderma arundinaceum]
MAEHFRMNPRPAPHSVLFAAGFPRVFAKNFPLGDREAFAKHYPYGLPVTYKMVHGVHSQGVAQSYLEDHLPAGFYMNVPPQAKAVISTGNGKRALRTVDKILPRRRIHLWSKDEIQQVCSSLRKHHWNELKNMQQPSCWDDLWTYFDAYDLYNFGCLNLWNVLNTLWDENRLISADVRLEVAAHVGHWADEWLMHGKNEQKLKQWKVSHGPIIQILSDQDYASLGLIQDDVVLLIANALKYRRAFLLSKNKRDEPVDLITACRSNGIENWLMGQRLFKDNGLPSLPESEIHRSSSTSNEPFPCLRQGGKHYFFPQTCASPLESPHKSTDAVKALQKSAGIMQETTKMAMALRPGRVTESGVVIVDGRNASVRPQASGGEADEKTQNQTDHRRISSMPETSSPVISERRLGLGHDETVETVDIETSCNTEARRSSESAALSSYGANLRDGSFPVKKENIETKSTRGLAENGHTAQNIKPIGQLCRAEGSLVSKKKNHHQSRAIEQSDWYSDMSRQLGDRIHQGGESQFPIHSITTFEQNHTPGAAGSQNNSAALKQFPSNHKTGRLPQEQRRGAESSMDGFKPSVDLVPVFLQPEKALAPQHAAANGLSHQGNHFYSPPNKSAPHTVPHRDFPVAPQAMPPQRFPVEMHSGAMQSAVYNTPTNDSDESILPTQQPRSEYLYDPSASSMHTEYRNNNRTHNGVGHRRGSQGQRAHGYVSGDRFGQVEEVFPAASQRKDAFIVRFAKESSVPQALAFGGGIIPEKKIRITVQPVHRSKWMKHHHQQQPRKFPLLPIVHHQSMQGASPPSGMGIAYPQTAVRSPSLTPIYAHATEPDQRETPLFYTGASVLVREITSRDKVDQGIALPIGPARGTPDADRSSQMLVHALIHDQSAFGENKMHIELDPASHQATISVRIDETQKEDVSRPKPQVQEMPNEKEKGCGTLTPGSEDSSCSSPKKSCVALPSTPIQPSNSSEDGSNLISSSCHPVAIGDTSPTPKNHEREVEEAPALANKDSPQPNNSSLGNNEQDDGGNENRPTTSELKAAQSVALKSAAKLLRAVMAPSEKHIEPAKMKEHIRIPSIFTEEEIKERRQAWNRISMPLDPRKSKKLGTSVIPGQPPMLHNQTEPSSGKTEKTTVSTLAVGEQVLLGSSDVHSVDGKQFGQLAEKDEVLTKGEVEECVKDKSFDNERGLGAPKQIPLRFSMPELSAGRTSEEGSCYSKSEAFEPSQMRSEKSAEDAAAASSKETSAKPPEEEPQRDDRMPTASTTITEAFPPSSHVQETVQESSAEPLRDSKEGMITAIRAQYHYDTLPRGRPDFRNNAGGSLKIPKKRKNRYPTITSKTFDASAGGKIESSQARGASGGMMPIADNDGTSIAGSATHIGVPNTSKKSRLNPLATAFESPRKDTAAVVDNEMILNSQRAVLSPSGSGEKTLGKTRSPSRFQIIQRPAAAQNSPTKTHQLNERFVRRLDGPKTAGSFEISTRQQENRPTEVKRDWSKDKHR